MKKILVRFAALAMAVTFALMGNAATQSTGYILTDNVTADKDLTVYHDYSVYPGTVGMQGKIVRFYDFAVQGGAASTTYKLMPPISLKDNTVIRDGYIKVMSGMLPTTSTNSIGINTATDLLAAGANQMPTADLFVATVPVGTAATFVQTTNSTTSYVTLTIGNVAITNGQIMVVLDAELAP